MKKQDHHFVPQFMLREWAGPTGNLTQFRFIEAAGGAVQGKGHVRSSCQVENLYALETAGDADRFALETKYFTPVVDTPAADAHRILVDEGPTALGRGHREAWIRFIVSLAVRMPSAISDMRTMALSHIDKDPEDYLRLRRPSDPPTLSGYVALHERGRFNDRLLQMLPDLIERSFRRHGPQIDEMVWKTKRLDERHEFVVGDAPLLTRPEHPYRNGVNLGHPGVLLVLPIAPRKLFLACAEKDSLLEARRMASSRLAAVCNAQSVRRCHERVFGTTRSRAADFVMRALDEMRGHRSVVPLAPTSPSS